MPMLPVGLRYLLHRALGLLQRSLSSLRTRGWRETCKQIGLRTPSAQARRTAALWQPPPTLFAPFSVPHADMPYVSVVIAADNQFARTLACLRALSANPPALALEIVLVDDGSSDATAHAAGQITGLRYHRRATNAGSIAAYNAGIALARGDYVVLLNHATVPQPGWLEALIGTFDIFPNAGLVGPQLLYPDGRLHASGGVVFADGSLCSYGRGASTKDPRYAYARAMDYCPAAALALPRALLHALGGLDPSRGPADRADIDLAFAVHEQGLAVLVQPVSRVVHDMDNGTDIETRETRADMKIRQVHSQDAFTDKWRTRLARQLPPGSVPSPALLHRHQRQVLILDECVPQPDRDSGSLRQFNLIRLLLREAVHVTFLPIGRKHASTYSQALQQLGVEVWHAPFLRSTAKWLRTHGARFHVVLLVRHHVAHACLPLLEKHAPQARRVFDTVDLHYLRERRGAELTGETRLLRAAERTRQRELDIMARTDVTLLVSAAEQTQLQADAPQVRTELLSNLHELAGHGAPFGTRQDLLFVGGFRHLPNADAMRWFLSAIFPLVRIHLPDVRFHCIGADAPNDVIALAQTCSGVILHGHVPDLRPYMEGQRIAVAPLRFGAGVKGKINMSMAHGQPVVATPCAVEGMYLHDGEEVCVAEHADSFAAAIVRLYNDPVLWQRLADNGRRNVARHFSFDAARGSVHRVFLA